MWLWTVLSGLWAGLVRDSPSAPAREKAQELSDWIHQLESEKFDLMAKLKQQKYEVRPVSHGGPRRAGVGMHACVSHAGQGSVCVCVRRRAVAGGRVWCRAGWAGVHACLACPAQGRGVRACLAHGRGSLV